MSACSADCADGSQVIAAVHGQISAEAAAAGLVGLRREEVEAQFYEWVAAAEAMLHITYRQLRPVGDSESSL